MKEGIRENFNIRKKRNIPEPAIINLKKGIAVLKSETVMNTRKIFKGLK